MFFDTEFKTAGQNLLEALPHGSGINGDWTMHVTDKTMDIKMSNTYSAMSEGGAYCCNWDFTVEFKRICDITKGQWEFVSLEMDEDTNDCECGCGLQEYLEGAMPY